VANRECRSAKRAFIFWNVLLLVPNVSAAQEHKYALAQVTFDGLFSVDCSVAHTKMFQIPKLLILLAACSDGIPVVALPASTKVASSVARLVHHHKKHDIACQTRPSFSMPFVTAPSWNTPRYNLFRR
jgi:hypothetical protein